MIEARIVEAEDKFSKNLGAKLFFGTRNTGGGGILEGSGQQTGTTKTAGGKSTDGIGLNIGSLASVNGNSVSLPAGQINGATPGSVALSLFNAAATKFIGLELSALEADGKGKIISSPRVVTANQLKAVIEQGTELPYSTASSSGATTITYRKAVLRLEVTPQITPDGNVILDVDVSKDSPGVPVPIGTLGSTALSIDTKHVNTQVLIENGGTVVIGGIYTQNQQNTITKIPFFGDIPIIGNLFKSKASQDNKTELLIFLSPKILNDKVVLR
jgi:type IV pilus assembly protein PilQ